MIALSRMSESKDILIITAFLPGRVGAAVNYTRQLIDDLATMNRIDVISFQFNGSENYEPKNQNIRILKVYNNSRLVRLANALCLPFLFPLFTVRFNWSRLKYILNQLKRKKYNLIILDHSQVALYGKFINKIPCVVMLHDVMTQRYNRNSSIVLSNFCYLSERFVLKNKSNVFSFSEKDKNLIKKLFKKDSQVTSFYLDSQVVNAIPDSVGDYIVFFAYWGRSDNFYGLEWFFNNVYPRLDQSIKIKIIGKGLSELLKEKIAKYSTVEYLDFIPNPYPIISNAKALISPLFSGAGVKVKVIESLACGTVVIGNEISFEGISEKYSSFFLSVDDAFAFVDRINNLQVNLDEKKAFKQFFINSYFDNNLVKFIQHV